MSGSSVLPMVSPVTSSTTLSPSSPSSSPTHLYTLSECTYQVSISSSQRAVLGIMGSSLVINFGLLVWWLRLYCYKRKLRRRGEEAEEVDYPEESDSENIELQEPSKATQQAYQAYRQPKYRSPIQEDLPDIDFEKMHPRKQMPALHQPDRMKPIKPGHRRTSSEETKAARGSGTSPR